MTLAAVQSVCHADGTDWVSVGEAAELTKDSVRAWQRRAQAEARAASRQRRRSLAVQIMPRNGRGRPMWHVHRSIDPRLARCPGRDTQEDKARESLLQRYPQHAVQAAYRRAEWLRRCDWHAIAVAILPSPSTIWPSM